MLQKTNRIKKKGDFDAIFRNSKIYKDKILILRVKKNGLEINRIGIIVSQKVSKKATLRNKIRRRISEIVGKSIKGFGAGTDVVFTALPGIDKKEFSEINESINVFIKKINLSSK